MIILIVKNDLNNKFKSIKSIIRLTIKIKINKCSKDKPITSLGIRECHRRITITIISRICLHWGKDR